VRATRPTNSDDAIYGIAKLEYWKHGLGQLCAYRFHLKRRKTILQLYGTAENPGALAKATQICNQYGIVVEYKRCRIPGSRLGVLSRLWQQ
jgi:hypothetical protein